MGGFLLDLYAAIVRCHVDCMQHSCLPDKKKFAICQYCGATNTILNDLQYLLKNN